MLQIVQGPTPSGPLLPPPPKSFPRWSGPSQVVSPKPLHCRPTFKTDTVTFPKMTGVFMHDYYLASISLSGFSHSAHQQCAHLRVQLCWMKQCRMRPRVRKDLRIKLGKCLPRLSSSCLLLGDHLCLHISLDRENVLPRRKAFSTNCGHPDVTKMDPLVWGKFSISIKGDFSIKCNVKNSQLKLNTRFPNSKVI